jgi:hypothetical protein
MKIELTEAQYQSSMKSGLPFQQMIQTKEGVAQLRFVVADGARLGSLILPLQ